MANTINPSVTPGLVNATTAAAPVAAATPAPAAAPVTLVTPLGPSTAKGATPDKVAITGIAAAIAQKLTPPSYTPSAGQTAGTQAWGAAAGRGFLETRVKPAVGGWDVELDVHTQAKDDEVNVFLSGRITDAPNEHWVVLGVPIAGKQPGTSTADDGMIVTTHKFFVSLADINDFLEKKGGYKADGKTPKIQFQPGDPLSFDGVWGAGHQSGGRRDQTKGYVTTPPVLGKQSIVDARAPGAKVGPAAVVTGKATEKPVDLTLKLPDVLVQQYPKVLMPGAKLVSRREEELKLEPKTFEELKDFTARMITIAKMPKKEQAKALEDIFGEKGWELHLTDRYYQKDKAGDYITYKKGEMVWKVKDDKGEHDFDFEGLPKVAGMYDQYQDMIVPPPQPGVYQYGKKDFQIAEQNGAVRFRDGEYKDGENLATMGKFNLKPGGGVVDPTSLIATRIEYALDTLPGIAKDKEAMDQMHAFLDKAPAPYNPMVEFKKRDYNLDGQAVQNNVLDNQAQRYKFTLKHKSGLEAEVSNDFISVTSKHDAIDPPSTKGKTIDEKFDYWQKQFDAQKLPFSTAAGDVNKGTFVEYANGGKHRMEIQVEVSTDAEGKKHVSEVLNVKGRQVEVEMDHVQMFTTGPVQQGSMTATTSSNVSTEAAEDQVFKGLSDNATMNGPPTVHNLEDLSQPELYEAGSYKQMKEAGVKLQHWAFKEGVNRTRQKAAYGLEMMGQIAESKPPQLGGGVYQNGFSVQPQNNVFQVNGDLTTGKPTELKITVDDFPMVIMLQGKEKASEIAEIIGKKLDECLLYKSQLGKAEVQLWKNGAYVKETVPSVCLVPRG